MTASGIKPLFPCAGRAKRRSFCSTTPNPKIGEFEGCPLERVASLIVQALRAGRESDSPSKSSAALRAQHTATPPNPPPQAPGTTGRR